MTKVILWLCLYEVSQLGSNRAGLLYCAGSAHALFSSLKIVVVLYERAGLASRRDLGSSNRDLSKPVQPAFLFSSTN